MGHGFGWIPPTFSLYASLPKHVHIWKASLTSPPLLSLSDKILTDEEKKQVTTIGSVEQRRRFKGTRACLRDVLSRYLQRTRPQDILFSRAERGKPVISRPSSNLQFNLAHTEDVLLIAVALTEIGVDIERRDRPLHNISALLRSRLSRNERMSIQKLSERISPDDRESFIRQEFLKTWTRKEAFVKSTGDGIAHGISRIEIVERDATLVVQDIASGISLARAFVVDLSPDCDHFGAVALTSDEPYEVLLMQYRAEQLEA